MYAVQASATAESAVGARTSTSAMCESPSGGTRIVAGPRTEKVHPEGAMKVAPAVVSLGVSAVSCCELELFWAAMTARVHDVTTSRQAIVRAGPPRWMCGIGFSWERRERSLRSYLRV